jgi:hypothetical protein
LAAVRQAGLHAEDVEDIVHNLDIYLNGLSLGVEHPNVKDQTLLKCLTLTT